MIFSRIKIPPEIAFGAGLLLIALAALVFAHAYTPRGGVITVGDSISYIAASRSIAAGEDPVRDNGRPLLLWPPLYPATITVSNAVGSALGVDLFGSIRASNDLINFLTLCGLGLLAGRVFRSRLLALLYVLAVGLSWPFFVTQIHAWSEPFYNLLTLAFIVLLAAFVREARWTLLVASAIMAGLATLQRYLGFSLMITGIVVILIFWKRPGWNRLRSTFAFSVVAMLPPGLWMIRTWFVTGTLLGNRNPSPDGLSGILMRSFTTIGNWYTPAPADLRWIIGVVVVVLLLLGTGWFVRRYLRWPTTPPADQTRILVMALFTAITLVVAIWAGLSTSSSIDDRVLGFVFFGMLWLTFLVLDRGLIRFTQGRSARSGVLAQAAVAGLVVLGLVATRSEKFVHEYSILSVWCCRDLHWEGTELIEWLNTHTLDGRVWTNDVNRSSLYAGLYFRQLPTRYQEDWFDQWAAALPPESYLVWFLNDQPAHYDPAQLETLVQLEPLQQYENGIIYRLTPRQ